MRHSHFLLVKTIHVLNGDTYLLGCRIRFQFLFYDNLVVTDKTQVRRAKLSTAVYQEINIGAVLHSSLDILKILRLASLPGDRSGTLLGFSGALKQTGYTQSCINRMTFVFMGFHLIHLNLCISSNKRHVRYKIPSGERFTVESRILGVVYAIMDENHRFICFSKRHTSNIYCDPNVAGCSQCFRS